MTGFTNIFGGTNISPAYPNYLPISISSSLVLQWPLESTTSGTVFSNIMDITATASSLTVTMPDATQTSPGQSTIITNRGANTFTVLDGSGGTIQAIAAGISYYIYLTGNSTTAGAWSVVQFGAGSSSASAAALAGLGTQAFGSILGTALRPSTISSPYTAAASDRGASFQWTGGTAVFTLPDAAGLSPGWFIEIKNNGSGNLTLTPTVGGQTVDGGATETITPGASCIVISTASAYFTVGLYNVSAGNTTRTIVNVGGNSNVTLTTAQASSNVLNLIGTLTGNIIVYAPASLAQYYVQNGTSGAFTLTFSTPSGTGIVIPQGSAMDLIDDGTNIIDAISAVGSGLTVEGNAVLGSPASSHTIAGSATVGNFSTATTVSGTTRFRGSAAGVDNQTGTTYTLTANDGQGILTFSNASASQIFLPQAGGVSFPAGWWVDIVNKGAGAVWLTNNTYTITAATQSSGGSSYAVNDTLTMPGYGGVPAVVKVSSVSGGAITGLTVQTAGTYAGTYGLPSPAVSTSGSGTGATINLTFTSSLSTVNVTGATVGSGGYGFAVNDLVQMPTGAGVIRPAILQVASITGAAPNAGQIVTVTVYDAGEYTTAPTNPVTGAATSGNGVGSPTFNLTTASVTPSTSTIDGASTFNLMQNQSIRLYSDGTNWITNRGKVPGYILIQYQLSQGTNNTESLTVGSWVARNLNTIVTDTTGTVQVGTTTFVLPPGIYQTLETFSTSASSQGTVAASKIITVSGTSITLYGDIGTLGIGGIASNTGLVGRHYVSGRMVITTPTILQLQTYIVQSAATPNGGYAANITGRVEIYSQIELLKVA